MIRTLFTCLVTVQLFVVVAHDLVDIPGWTHGAQVRAVVGRRKFWLATLINAIFPGLAAGTAVYFWGRPALWWVVDYWVVYCAVAVASAVAMWYIPYFFGASESKKREYASMYAGTKHVLPPRGDNLRPNLLHVCIHALFLVNLGLALALRFGGNSGT